METTTLTPQGCTNFKLRQLMRLVGRHYDAELGHAGLKTTQFSLLTHVQRMGPVRPVDLAHAMGLMPSSLTRNVQPMVAAGWLAMAEGADARSRLITITDAGREKRSEAHRDWRKAQLALNAVLGNERVVALHTLIDDSLALLAQGDTPPGDHDD